MLLRWYEMNLANADLWARWAFDVRVTCRIPVRRPGNFHLRGQMKVTKAKALNYNLSARSARAGAAPGGPLGSSATHRTGSALGGAGFATLARANTLDSSRVHWTQGQSAARPRRVRCRHEPQRALQVARRAGRANEKNGLRGFAFKPFALVTFIWASNESYPAAGPGPGRLADSRLR